LAERAIAFNVDPIFKVNTMMTQQQVIGTVQLDTKANSHDKFEQHIEEKVLQTVPFALGYTFNYARFDKPDLQAKAKSTLGNFLGFVRQTFDGLLDIGRSLQDLYYDCIAFCPNGKKVFDEWLASQDFGASRYIASSAMEISAWFDKLPPKVQRLVQQNVQQWSVSALRQLTKVSHDLVKELVRTGKKTAAQVKEKAEKKEQKEKSNNIAPLPPSDTSPVGQLPAIELAAGMRVVVTGDDMGWNGHSGIIMCNQEGNFWILLDHTIAQGMEIKHLFKPQQIQPEAQQPFTKPASKETFTEAQVEQKIAEALAQREREKAEEEQGRFVEIRDAALQAAKQELIAAEQHANAIAKRCCEAQIAQAKQELIEQLEAKENELQSVRALQTKNQQLSQRVAELEKALENASVNNWGNTFSQQAAKVVNSDLEKTISPLMSEVDRLTTVLSQREQELSQLQTINRKQQDESISDSVVAEFGEIGERFGWSGWSRRGYRAASGMFCTGVSAISAFISDLKASHPTYQQQEIAF
jgi:hypothetical protein